MIFHVRKEVAEAAKHRFTRVIQELSLDCGCKDATRLEKLSNRLAGSVKSRPRDSTPTVIHNCPFSPSREHKTLCGKKMVIVVACSGVQWKGELFDRVWL